MAKTYDLLVRARGETRDAERAMKQLQRSVKGFGRNVGRVGQTMSAAITAPLLALGVMGARELGDIERANAQTVAAIKRLGPASMIGVKGVQALAAALQEKSGMDDQAIQTGANLILSMGNVDTSTRLGVNTVKIATRSMVEYAEQTGITAEVAGKQYAAAMAAAANGTLKLPRGMKLGKEATEKLKAAMESAAGPTERQALLMDALGKKFAGSMKLTNADKWAVAMDKLAGVGAKLVVMLIPALEKLVGWIGKLTDWFGQLSPQTQKFVGVGMLLAVVLGPLLIVVGGLVGACAALIPVMIAIGPAVGAAIAAGAALWATFGALYAKSETFRGGVNRLIEALRKNKQWLLALLGPFGMAIASMVTAYHAVKNLAGIIVGALRSALNWVRDHAASAWTAVVSWIGNAVGKASGLGDVLAGAVRSGFGWVRDNAASAWSAVVGKIDSAADKARALGSALGGAVVAGISWIRDKGASAWSAFESAASTVRSIVQQIASVISAIRSGLEGALSKAGRLADKLPDVPFFARGGIVTRATRAVIGEAGPEAVVPLGGSLQNQRDRMRVMGQAGLFGGGESRPQVVINASSADAEAIARRVSFILGGSRLRMGGGI